MRDKKHKIYLTHLFTENEDHQSIQNSMNAVADEIIKTKLFENFDLTKFRSIPEGDGVISPAIYANILISKLFNYADDNRIQID